MTAEPVSLTEFLLARIAEDEAVAQAAANSQGANWQDEGGVLSGDIEPVGAPGRYLHMYAPEGRWMLWDCEGAGSLCVAEPTSAHIARHDPARVLADCAAKRAIVEEYAADDEAWRNHPAPENPRDFTDWHYDQTPEEFERFQAWNSAVTMRGAVERLAAVYADHADFQEEWRV